MECQVSWEDGTREAWEQEEPTHPSLREGRWAQSLRWPELPQRTDEPGSDTSSGSFPELCSTSPNLRPRWPGFCFLPQWMSCFATLRNDGLRGLGQGCLSVAGGTGFVHLCLPALTLLLSAVPRAPLASPESHVETGVFPEGRGVQGTAVGFPGGGPRPHLSCQASDGNRSRKISGLFLIAASFLAALPCASAWELGADGGC